MHYRWPVLFAVLPASVLLVFATGRSGVRRPPSFANIKVAGATSQGAAPCEPSIAVSRTNTKNIVAAVILDRTFATLNSGQTWTEKKVSSPLGVFGDPTVVSDKDGNFFFFHLATQQGEHLGRIVCQKSTDGGLTWSAGADIGHNPPTQQDKQWATVHPTKPYVYVTWTQFDRYGSTDPLKHSNIMFSMSKDSGAKWSKPVQVNDIPGDCLDDDGTTEGAVPAVSADGTVYVTWSSQGIVFFDKSTDEGKTWLRHDVPVTRQYGGWNMTIPGISRSNGMPVLMVDDSNGPYRGRLYVVWADQRAGAADTDVFITTSKDKGDTWSTPMRINKDGPGKQQFLPWLAVDQATGSLYVVYYDRRAYDDNQTDVYLAWSSSGGKSFAETKISERPFLPIAGRFFGDYNNISAHRNVIAPVWTRMDDGKTTVWTAVIKQADLPTGD